ncbi:MAG: formate dehydrogenase subunit alpha [Wenzhouxiangella sp.]
MKLIRKQTDNSSNKPARGSAFDRRTFLKRSGLTAGTAAVAGSIPLGMMRRVEAQTESTPASSNVEIKRTVCSHCSVGCGAIAHVENGVWVGQEPDFDSPLNLGAHCAKGASLRYHGLSEKRVRYPMKLVDGEWKRLSWQEAVDEIGDYFLKIREESGPDAIFWCGSSKASNEGAYLQRKFAAFWGSNNIDHQARICHSTTVAGVANTWGYGAMTNSYNDMHNAKAMLFIGSNAAEAHPVAMQHILRGKENGAKMIVVDPRYTRTAAHSDQHIRIRPGSDVGFIWGLLWHIFENGWEDSEYISQRVYGLDRIREEVANWDPAACEDVTGVDEETMRQAAQTLAENRPGTIVWCMGGTQHHIGNNNTRAYCVLQLALGNIGVSGGGANIFRGHDNVQGATDVGPNCQTLPGYYGLADGAWKHWARVWDVDYDWIRARFDNEREYDSGDGSLAHPMNIPGIAVSRWIDGILEDPENLSQRDNLRAVFFQGHAVNSQTRGPEMKKAIEKLDMVVVSDPYPTHLSIMSERKNGVYLLPTCTQFEQEGSVTASNRSLQWRQKVIDPMFESKPDAAILYMFAQKFGFADKMFKNIAVDDSGTPSPEDTLREINRGHWTIGYTGQSPERLKLHAANRHTFDTTTLVARGGPCDGETYGLPWPCWGTPEMAHPGTHILYDTSKPVSKGGLTFRARFGTEHEGNNILAEGSYSKDSDLEDGYPEFSYGMLRRLGWQQALSADEVATIAWVAGLREKPTGTVSEEDVAEFRNMESDALDGVNWKTDLSGGIQRVAIAHECAPFGNAKARAIVWTFPDQVPLHREPLYTARYDLVSKYPTFEDRKSLWRVPTRYASIQATDYSGDYPLVFTSGRLVEYEGGGEETRSMKWLAELQQDMFVEINPADANDRGIKDNQWVWLEGPEGGHIKIRAMITDRVGRGVVWTPFHFGGWFQGEDLYDRYPEGTAPYVRGEACNTATTYGYDPTTQMQETKSTLCQIKAA